MVLHGLLHSQSHSSCGCGSIGEPQLVNVGNGGFSSIVTQFLDGLSRLVLLGDGLGTGPAENYQVQQGVGPQPVGAVDGGAGGLAGGVEAGDNLILTVLVSDDLKNR